MMLSEEGGDSNPPRNDDSARPATESGNYDVAEIRRSSITERLASKMFSYSTEIICLLLAITLTLGFAAIHSAPPRVSKPPTARPFFNQSSVILDFYKGHLDALVKRASDADLSFVMYYAPWDAESQAVRHKFECVAQYYYSKIFFAAINCWHPGSECRSQYNKIERYPLLILYPSRDTAIPYTGIKTAPYMMRFLDNFMSPIHRIRNRHDLKRLLVESDAVVVGFIDFQGISVSPGYKEFYRTAIRFLGRDPNRDVAFAIVTNAERAEKEFGIYSFPSATLSMWNETLIYPTDKSWTSQSLVNWISGSMHKVALWLQPPGVKSLTLAPFMRDGPVLLLFTPRNPLHESNHNFNLMKEVALQYYSCGDIGLTGNLVRSLRHILRIGAVSHQMRSRICSIALEERKKKTVSGCSPGVPSVSTSAQRWINDSCCARIVMNKCQMCKKAAVDAGVCSASDNFQEICKGSDIFTSSLSPEEYEDQQFCCDSGKNWSSPDGEPSDLRSEGYETEKAAGEHDPRSTSAMRQAFIADECTKLLAGNKYHYPIFPHVPGESEDLKVTEAACRVNKTLAFIAIDSLHYFHFSEALGIDLLKMKDKTAVVILDSDQESQYVMNGTLTRVNLVKFINDFTEGLLKRNLRSDSSRRFARDFQSSRGCEDTKESEVCLRELTTDTFEQVVMDPTRDVVVMYHSPYCAFCSAVAYVYLTVAKYLAKMEHLIFVRIDGDNNDLSWEYSMNRYPSILFFPAKRKEDSTVYPFSLPITIPNLLNFVLANLEGDSHVEGLVNICSLGAGEPPKDCVARIRRLCLDIIEELLRKYRKIGRNRGNLSKVMAGKVRREILVKLEHIRDVHLVLSAVDDLSKDEVKLQRIREKFKNYYNILGKITKRNNSSEKTETFAEKIVKGRIMPEGKKIRRDEL